MSFITKRERVFNEYDVYDIPARNEGKLKAYASCTDARAWSHFCSDKSEHLVEIIKRNNDMCRPKYVPTNVIIDTLMIGKNAEIARLKRKIEQFEKMLAAYDELDLTCDQKCEIAKAHAAIKEANKELNELCLDLDISGFTEGSEPFETGKSRGDETGKSRGDETAKSFIDEKESKSIQTREVCPCDVSTMASDPRIEEMQDAIINKDAKLNAMQNTIAVMENDVCEPYCIYAHIYTALEKIFGVLCQNHKYKLYLEMMTGVDKRNRCMDIKGKILLKLKILEKFSMALVAPCSREMANQQNDSLCYRAEVTTRVESIFALTSAESAKPYRDKNRCQLVADIMENEEMRDILCKDCNTKIDLETEDYTVEDYNIDTVNLNRLKQLQENYDDMINCYESLKHEKECLMVRCCKYEELEKDFESMKCQLREYNSLWNEKEHYRKRSVDLDDLKEQFLILSNETYNLETQLKAEAEINDVKTKTIDDLRKENIALENKLNNALIAFEKEKNTLQCKIKECECKEMCQDQQIKSLTVQIDSILEQDSEHPNIAKKDDLSLLDEINVQKEQIQNLKNLLYGSEDEKQQLQDEFQNKLNLINDLKMEIEDWKSTYEKTLQRNQYLTDEYSNEFQKLVDTNNCLTREIADKESTIEKLITVLNEKSHEVNQVMETLEQKNEEIRSLKDLYQRNMSSLDNQKMEAMNSLQVARQESQELLQKVKKYADRTKKEEELANNLQLQSEEFRKLKQSFENTQMENKALQNEIKVCDTNNGYLREEIERLKKLYIDANENISNLEDEKEKYRLSLQLTRRESQLMSDEKLHQFEDLSHQLNKLRHSHEKLMEEKCRLENELHNKNLALANATQSIQVSKSQSDELLTRLQESETKHNEFLQLTNERNIREKQALQRELSDKANELENVLQSFEELQFEVEKLHQFEDLSHQLNKLRHSHEKLMEEKCRLENELHNKNLALANATQSIQVSKSQSDELLTRLQESETKHNEFLQLTNERNIREKQALQRELSDKANELENVLQSFEELKNRHDHKCQEIENLSKELTSLQEMFQKLLIDKTLIQSHYNNKAEELNKICDSLEMKIKENRELHNQIQILENNRNALVNDIDLLKTTSLNIQMNLNASQKESEDLMRKMKYYETLETEYDRLKTAYDKTVADKNRLKEELEVQMSDLRKLQRENNDLHSHGQNLQSHSKDLENALARTELISKLGEPDLQSTIIKQIEDMKREKLNSHQRIRELLNKMEELENTIASLSEDVLARDDRIAILENHINELQDEVERLHSSLALAVDVGEDITNTSHRKIQESMHNLDAHHSKATHNMRIELAKLRSDNMKLEEQLSANKIKSEEFDRNKIIELQNEREIIVTDIKELELQSVGETALGPNKCDVEDILSSLDRIRKVLDNRSIKSSTLEHTLQKVQGSYQLVQAKADEAKKIVEKEISEKEEAIRDRISLEKQLEDLKQQLSTQQCQNKKIIKDLESEIQNQKLIINQIKKSKDSYIKKMDEEMRSLQSLYQNSQQQIKDVEGKLKSINDEHNKTINTCEELNKQLGEKCKEIEALRKQLNNLKKTPSQDATTQVYPINTNTAIQTEKTVEHEHYIRYENDKSDNLQENIQQTNVLDQNVIRTDNPKPLNEVQVLTANVNPNFDYSKPEFSHKIQQVNALQSEEDFSGPSDQDQYFKKEDNTSSTIVSSEVDKNLIDIYSKKSMLTNSINQIDQNITEAESGESGNNENQSTNSTDKDLFVIYRDSDSLNCKNPEKMVIQWSNGSNGTMVQSNGRSEVLVESVSMRPQINVEKQLNRQQNITNDSITDKESEEPEEDDSVKEKLHIRVPRVDIETQSEMFKSVESYTLYSTTKEYTSSNYKTMESDIKNMRKENQPATSEDQKLYIKSLNSEEATISRNRKLNETSYMTNEVPLKTTEPQNIPESAAVSPESHNRLTRVEADAFLIKNNEQSTKKQNENFALNYILDSFLLEGQDEKSYNAIKALRKVRSDEHFTNTIKISGRRESSPSKLSPSKLSDLKTSENKTFMSGYSPSKTSHTSESKFYVEQSVMAKLDSVEDYETKIRHLSKTLENIEKDYKMKIEVIKLQYDNNIKSIINEHNLGVNSIQSLHEETLHDIIKMHENEVENWRSMSIEAMRKADILEKENKNLICKIRDSCSTGLDEEPIKITTNIDKPELTRRRKSRIESIMLTKTNVEAFNVKPKIRNHGPCTCSLDVNVSDTIRHIFEQVDVDQGKLAEQTYVRYIANKIISSNVESLDTKELSFLHFKVCRIWKMKLTKEELLQKRIDSLETELLKKQKNTQQNIAELDRKVAEERLRLQEVREAVCRHTTVVRKEPVHEVRYIAAPATTNAHSKELKHSCLCDSPNCKLDICERRSAGDLTQTSGTIRPKRSRVENSRAVLAKLDVDERREKKMFTDETPTRLRKQYDRSRSNKKH